MKPFLSTLCLLLFLGAFSALAGPDFPPLKEVKSDTFTVSGVEKGSVFDRVGLKNGDVIVRYNGNPVQHTKGLRKRLETLFKVPGSHKLEVKRNGKVEVLIYEVK